MIVVCVYTAAQPNEVQLAVGDGAGSVQIVTAERLLREAAEQLLDSGHAPVGRGETGVVGPFQDVSGDDVLISVTWENDEPQLDYCAARAATVDQLLAAAIALNEYVRFSIWNSRFRQELAVVQPQVDPGAEARERAASAIHRAARMPVDWDRMGRA